MQQHLSRLRQEFQNDLKEVQDSRQLEQLKVKYLGKKGPIQELMLHLREAPSEKRPLLGKEINDLKEEIAKACEQALIAFSQSELQSQIASEKLDITQPGRRERLGREHPIAKVMNDLIDILIGM